MGVHYQVYGLMKNKQKDLDWYLKYERYTKEKHINFEFEERTGEIFETLILFASKTIDNQKPGLGEGGYIFTEEDIKEFVKSVNENMFEDKAQYYKLMAEIHDFYVSKMYEKYLIVTFSD